MLMFMPDEIMPDRAAATLINQGTDAITGGLLPDDFLPAP